MLAPFLAVARSLEPRANCITGASDCNVRLIDSAGVDPFLTWLESTALSIWVRESLSLFAFPGILALHTIGMGIVAGMNGAIALRILGAAPQVSLFELKRFVPAIWFGFWLNAVSGVVLLIGYPTKALTNPVFYVKLLLIALGLVAFKLIRHHVFRDPALAASPLPGKVKRLAIASLVCWAGAIGTGRFLAYTYTRLAQGF